MAKALIAGWVMLCLTVYAWTHTEQAATIFVKKEPRQ